MKKIFIIILLILGLTGCTNSGSKYTEPSLIKYDEFMTKIENKETFTLLMWQTGCSHCESFEPRLNNVIKKYDIQMYSINLAELSETEYAKVKNKTFISGTPTTVYIKEGKLQPTRLVGDKSEEQIIEFFKNYDIIK